VAILEALSVPADADAAPECAGKPAVLAAGPDMSIAEVAALTGISAHTLRYYERIGLLRVPRDAAGHRSYGPVEVGRITFISLLRATAMPIRDLQLYFGLVAAGPGNEAERVAVLERHRDHLTQSLADLQAARELIDWKLDRYRAANHPAPTPGAP
jgi:DNA-binding transcriptional MerR regulator